MHEATLAPTSGGLVTAIEIKRANPPLLIVQQPWQCSTYRRCPCKTSWQKYQKSLFSGTNSWRHCASYVKSCIFILKMCVFIVISKPCISYVAGVVHAKPPNSLVCRLGFTAVAAKPRISGSMASRWVTRLFTSPLCKLAIRWNELEHHEENKDIFCLIC